MQLVAKHIGAGEVEELVLQTQHPQQGESLFSGVEGVGVVGVLMPPMLTEQAGPAGQLRAMLEEPVVQLVEMQILV